MFKYGNKYIIILLFLLFFLYIKIDNNYKSLFSYLSKNKPKISIFVPVYNAESYIKECIESIQHQTLKDIEIIAVNDYSNDSSLSILIDLANKDNRIKIVNNDKNHGLLFSRSMGILNSKGEYIMNLDSDDKLNDDECLEYLYKQTEMFKVDIITFNILYKKIDSVVKCEHHNEILLQPKLFKYIFLENNDIKDFWICNKLIKREIFLKAYEYFRYEIYNGKWNYFEDDIWNILVSRYAKSKLCLDRLVYIYNYNDKSLMNKRFGAIEFQNILYRHEMYKKIFQQKEDEKYLIAEYYFLYNRLKWELEYLLLLKDNNIKDHIKNIFQHFINNYNCSIQKRNHIINFLNNISKSQN